MDGQTNTRMDEWMDKPTTEWMNGRPVLGNIDEWMDRLNSLMTRINHPRPPVTYPASYSHFQHKIITPKPLTPLPPQPYTITTPPPQSQLHQWTPLILRPFVKFASLTYLHHPQLIQFTPLNMPANYQSVRPYKHPSYIFRAPALPTHDAWCPLIVIKEAITRRCWKMFDVIYEYLSINLSTYIEVSKLCL